MNNTLQHALFCEIDEIDHITILARKGQPIPAARAAALLLRHAALDPAIAAALALTAEEHDPETLAARPPERLVSLLTAAREVLMRQAGLSAKRRIP